MENLKHEEGTLDASRFTRKEAADYLRLSLVSIDRAIAKKSIACYRLGRRVVFGKHHLDDFLSRNEVQVKVGKGRNISYAV